MLSCSLGQILTLTSKQYSKNRAAVARALQGSPCSTLTDALLHTMLVTSSYLSYFCLHLKAVWPFPSDLWHQRVVLPGYFLFYKPWRWVCGKISAVAHLATMPHSKSVESPVLLILMLSLKVQEADTKKTWRINQTWCFCWSTSRIKKQRGNYLINSLTVFWLIRFLIK